MKRSAVLTGIVLLFLPARGPAQADNYDFVRKIRAFEATWEAHANSADRRRALPVLKTVVPYALVGRTLDAVRCLDQAGLLLNEAEFTADKRWAAALSTRPIARICDPADGQLSVELRECYDPQAERPANAQWKLSLPGKEPSTTVPLTAVPLRVQIPIHLPAGDHVLRTVVTIDDKIVARHEAVISLVPRWRERLEALRNAATHLKATTESLTLRTIVATLSEQGAKAAFESDFPAARLFTEAEALARSLSESKRYYDLGRPGQFWLTLATAEGIAPVRLFVPAGLTADKPVPVVVAMHGLGMSENYFFDCCGCGATVRECEKRGWLLVATRSAGFHQLPPVAAIVDELARRYPVDRKRVYLVGHSMGATHVVDAAQAAPGKVTAIAALGGGGTVRSPETLRGLPVFVGCGTEDFAISWARSLVKALTTAGADVTVNEYADVEHVAIVQEALKDVFTFFASHSR